MIVYGDILLEPQGQLSQELMTQYLVEDLEVNGFITDEQT